MTSLLTNTAAMSSLQSLTATQRQLSTTQAQISSGLAVATAADNAAYWSISTSMRAQTGSLDAADTASSLGKAVVDVAYDGLTSIIQDLSKMKALVLEAMTSGVDRTAIDSSLAGLEQQIRTTAVSSSVNGVNLLATDVNADDSATFTQNVTSQTNVVIGVSPSGVANTVDVALQVPLYGGEGPLEVGAIQTYGLFDYLNYGNPANGSSIPATIDVYSGYSINNMITSSLSASAGAPGCAADIDTMLTAETEQLDTMISFLGGYAAKLGAVSNVITNMQTFNSSLSDALTSGIGSLVDADMNVASTRLQALQTQQQLGIEALSIANNDNQVILKLFASG